MLQWNFTGEGEGVEVNNKQQRATVSTASFRGCTCPLARPELSEAPHPLSLLRAHRINASAVRNRETTRGEGCGRREQTRHNRNPPPTRDLKLSPGGTSSLWECLRPCAVSRPRCHCRRTFFDPNGTRVLLGAPEKPISPLRRLGSA